MSEMFGVVNGIYQCNVERDVELSNRISQRNIPSSTLEPVFSIRPVSSKYALLPIFDRRAKSVVPIKKEPTYEVSKVFNPGSAHGPWSGFASRINDETILRNQIFALQNCEQSNYVPASNSDMYHVHVDGNNQIRQPHPDLFTKPVLEPFNPNECNLGSDLFNNSTRVQVKNL